MTTLLDSVIPRTLNILLERFSSPEWTGARLEAWLFEDEPARRDGEAKLSEFGIQARLRSAYKPLMHAFLEDGLPSGPIRLPCHRLASPDRFALEAYPLAGLMPEAPRFIPGKCELDYVLADGTKVFAPNRPGADPLGRLTLNCCGWLRVWRAGAMVIDTALETEFEQVFSDVLQAVAAHPWPDTQPFFPVLHIDIETGGIHRKLGLAHECIDTQEALHEDLYFSLIEMFLARLNLPAGDRTLRPGQIVPEVRPGTGDTHARVRIVDRLAEVPPLGPEPLETASRALDAREINEILAGLEGERFTATSVQGRKIHGLYRPGSLPGLVVTGGQHANETSAEPGLLRAAPLLLAEPNARLALVPLENPDGYALHRRLCATHPHHMHHAARYTAEGCDLEARQTAPFYETGARRAAIARTEARLHISLHGYPAQEWTRPLSGYVPATFGGWTLPCGFFLILRHHPGLEAQGLAFLEALTADLAADADLVAMNRAQLALRAAHSAPDETLLLNDIPCRMNESTRSPVPFTLITEYPDETITGATFQQSHTVQRNTVLAAARLLWKGMLTEP